jgi:predicted nucleic acid-binding protein
MISFFLLFVLRIMRSTAILPFVTRINISARPSSRESGSAAQFLLHNHGHQPRRLRYADAFCIATARRLDAAVLTNDPEFQSVENLITIRWLTK